MAHWRGEQGPAPGRPNGGAEEGAGRAGSPKLVRPGGGRVVLAACGAEGRRGRPGAV